MSKTETGAYLICTMAPLSGLVKVVTWLPLLSPQICERSRPRPPLDSWQDKLLLVLLLGLDGGGDSPADDAAREVDRERHSASASALRGLLGPASRRPSISSDSAKAFVSPSALNTRPSHLYTRSDHYSFIVVCTFSCISIRRGASDHTDAS